jgi:glycosyltransferase involved in cell wall biosynthesis
MAEAMLGIANNADLAEQMKAKGLTHAQQFLPEKCASAVMEVYKEVLQ